VSGNNNDEEPAYTEAQIREARRVFVANLGYQPTDEEVREALGGTSQPGSAGPTSRSGRTIHVDESDPADTSKSGRHKAPGAVARFLGFGRKN
jgi:hypothetical protein